MRVLLYGGTFDPPHNGHLHNLRAAAAVVKPDMVVVMPAGVPPHKAASGTPAALRLEMCGCFTAMAGSGDIPALEVSDWEIRQAAQGIKNYSANTIAMLGGRYPGAQLFMAVGSDMLLSFDTWYHWQDLLQACTLVVTSREEDDMDALRAKALELEPTGSRIVFAAAPALPMASSTLRARMAAGDRCAEALPLSVLTIIDREGLYRPAGARRSLTVKQAKAMAKKALSEKRFQHTVNVKKLAVKLAKRHGEDPERAALAAYLHDVAKEMPKDELLQILRDNAIMANNAAERPAPVWHGVCAAILAEKYWGVRDREVLDAVACHTTGRPGMTKLDKILFLADMTSAERDWPGVKNLRKLAKKDLDAAMLAGLEQTVGFVKSSKKPVDVMSVRAYEDLKQSYMEKERQK